ncbi:MAG: glycine--tRNA ligase subunit beta [bacterium]|nr:glycine--tRNA ligase subunit beta [bacterium]
MKNFLLEIGTEELPAVIFPDIIGQIEDRAKNLLDRYRIDYENIEIFATPRRLILFIYGIGDSQRDEIKKVKGPPKNVSLDNNGNPTKALLGFVERQGCSIEDIKFESTPQGEYAFAYIKTGGRPVKDLLGEFSKELISSLEFQRNMYWEDTRFLFSRPIRWLLSLLDDEVISFELAGVKSGRYTYGHRFLAPGPFEIKSVRDYKDTMKASFVMFDHRERRDYILKEVEKRAEGIGAKPILTEELLNEINFLIEYPFVILGEFSSEFLEIPREILTTVMIHHQRYIPLEKDGSLYNWFIIVSNMGDRAEENIKRGNERVISARFSDAKFFYKRDTAIPLRDRIEDLEKISLPGERGTLKDKVEKMRLVLNHLIHVLELYDIKDELNTALNLCETDRTTEMVKEFPELHGIIGGIYARLNEKEDVWKSIYYHESENPPVLGAKLLAISEKMYDIVSHFNEGYIPSGSQDPYGLRRSAYILVSLLGDSNIDVELGPIMDILECKDKKEVWDFLSQRLYVYLLNKGIKRDLVESALGLDTTSVAKITSTALILQKLSTKDSFPLFITSAVRCYRITKDMIDLPVCNPNLFEVEDERDLYRFISNFPKDMTSLEERYNALLPLVEMLDRFFKNVFVMVDDEKIKNNRLSLLREIYKLFSPFGDLTKVEERL